MDKRIIVNEKKSGGLAGRVAIVTGSSSGIGLGIAKALAKSGVSVVLSGSRPAEKLETVLKEFGETFPDVEYMYVQANLSELPKGPETIVNATMKKFGRIDILVNNAGVQHVAPIDEFPTSKWDFLLTVNLSSAFYMTRLVVPIMRENSDAWGRIVNISSVHGLVASKGKAAYVASKHGLVGLTKVVALDTAENSSITCNVICPGWVQTSLIDKQIQRIAERDSVSVDEARVTLLSHKQPRPRFTLVEDVAAYTLFLCSEAARNITGATQSIDGGWTTR